MDQCIFQDRQVYPGCNDTELIMLVDEDGVYSKMTRKQRTGGA